MLITPRFANARQFPEHCVDPTAAIEEAFNHYRGENILPEKAADDALFEIMEKPQQTSCN